MVPPDSRLQYGSGTRSLVPYRGEPAILAATWFTYSNNIRLLYEYIPVIKYSSMVPYYHAGTPCTRRNALSAAIRVIATRTITDTNVSTSICTKVLYTGIRLSWFLRLLRPSGFRGMPQDLASSSLPYALAPRFPRKSCNLHLSAGRIRFYRCFQL